MPPTPLYALNFDKSLSIHQLKLCRHLADCGENRRHGKGETIQATCRVVGIPDVMQAGVSDGPRLVNVVELSAVVSDEDLIVASLRVRQQEAVLLSLPAKFLNVIDLVLRKQPTQWFNELHRDVLVKQQPHSR